MQPAAIARLRNVTANVVSVTLHRAREALRTCIQRRMVREGTS